MSGCNASAPEGWNLLESLTPVERMLCKCLQEMVFAVKLHLSVMSGCSVSAFERRTFFESLPERNVQM